MADFTLATPRAARPRISLVAMVDVLLILLVFFMVTSTYLDLDMLPAGAQSGAAGSGGAQSETVLIRINAEDEFTLQGSAVTLEALRGTLAAQPGVRLLILPSSAASTQALVSLLDLAAALDQRDVRILQLGGAP